MNRVYNKAFFGILSFLFICTCAQAIENEFKNSLVKIDLVKIGENTYNVDLYTQNKFLEPVKVIKKSDLNYYILLPETKNNTTKTSSNGSEIRNITTDLYPYAGQDVNNGYTIINISTTRPLNFNVNTRSIAAASKITDSAAKTALANAQEVKKEQIQKKNSDSLAPKEVVTKNPATSPKLAPETVNIKPKIKTPKNIEPKAKEVLQVDKIVKEEIENSQQEINETQEVPQEVLVELDENKIIQEEPSKEIIDKQEVDQIKQIAKDGKPDSLAEKFSNIKASLEENLTKNGLSLNNILLMLLAALLTFMVTYKLLSKKSEQARLKSRADLVDKDELQQNTIQVNTQNETQNDGQYFVFDKSIKQTGFCDPATSAIKRNYELSSYEPELKDKYERAKIGSYHPNKKQAQQDENEYDIIQKILKEDSFIDLSADKYNEVNQTLTETPLVKVVAPTSSPIETPQTQQEVQQQTQVKEKEEEIAEPTVLSSVEVAPERGFMCVSYNNNINLLGYIFDDVFPLYNFKLPKLENYDIKFRLSEKNDKQARFIVKVANTKMLVNITKTSMNMEVLL